MLVSVKAFSGDIVVNLPLTMSDGRQLRH